MAKELWTIGRLLQWTEQYFSEKGVDTPRLDGEVLLSHVIQQDRIYLYTHYDKPMVQEELDAYRALVIKRTQGYSTAAITGEKEFMGLSFIVNDKVLIPRPDTETLIEGLLERIGKDDAVRILDVCCGPSTIISSLLHYLPHATGVGVDISEDALMVAEKNQVRFHLEERLTLQLSDMFQQVPEQLFDYIVSNPPYITSADMKTLAIEVLHEPRIALYGGEDGLDFYRILAEQSGHYLRDGGVLAMEVGIHQAEPVQALLSEAGFSRMETWRDLGGIERVVIGEWHR